MTVHFEERNLANSRVTVIHTGFCLFEVKGESSPLTHLIDFTLLKDTLMSLPGSEVIPDLRQLPESRKPAFASSVPIVPQGVSTGIRGGLNKQEESFSPRTLLLTVVQGVFRVTLV